MPKHEYFHELCATASLGEASAAELAELNDHLQSCPECQRRYADFGEIHASHYAGLKEHELTESESVACIDSPLLRRRFFERAESEGIIFSRNPVLTQPAPIRSTFRSKRLTLFAVPVGLAAALAVGSAFATFYFVNQRVAHHTTIPSNASVTPALEPRESPNRIGILEHQNSELKAQLNASRTAVLQLSEKIDELRRVSTHDQQQVQLMGTDLRLHEREEEGLADQLQSAKHALGELQSQLTQVRASAADNENALVEAKVRVNDLTQQLSDESKSLEREKELFVAGKDIRQLMAARNLHIVDVFDTDPKGKTQAAFGRIFFTEGKSLLFYAYDLNDKRVQDAGYNYRVWGKREGPAQRAKNLGIFYSDDKSQKRWVFQYDDPKVLQEIDSVFVTLEPPNGDGIGPKGQKLMYAYLRGQANHP